MLTKINVTQEDINIGKSLRSVGPKAETCPVALAMRRDWQPDAMVGGTTYGRQKSRRAGDLLGVDDVLGTDRKSLPLAAQHFINTFDRALPVKPMSFWVS